MPAIQFGFFQGENDSSHINISAIGLTKNSPNKNAIKLIEYLMRRSTGSLCQ